MKVKNILFELNKIGKYTFLDSMQIKFIYLSNKLDVLIAKMPVTKKILQPFGYLHGGATATLAESVGSSLSLLNLKRYKKKKN
ncbi:hotdog fold thioesterase [Blattabacterium cuenoti]|uniref:hotdog fold thioesterase n=1 Tax=Blattabacterium cuenoti TaxID=1653831 RepID=UPI001EEA06A9|nr:hotdog fold thioesterase [Blattabacterium cuenoti]